MIPFFIEKEAACPICKGVSTKGEILSGSQKTMTRLLQQKMEAIETFQVLPLEKVEETLTQWDQKQFEEKPIPSAIQIGKRAECPFHIGWISLPL